MIQFKPAGQEMPETGNHDFTVDGKCSGCAECCSAVIPLTESDITRITRYVKKHSITPENHIVAGPAGPAMDLLCPFLDLTRPKGRQCKIYPVRPAMCRCYLCKDFVDMKSGSEKFAELAKHDIALREIIGLPPERKYADVRAIFFPNKNPDGKAVK